MGPLKLQPVPWEGGLCCSQCAWAERWQKPLATQGWGPVLWLDSGRGRALLQEARGDPCASRLPSSGCAPPKWANWGQGEVLVATQDGSSCPGPVLGPERPKGI